MEDPTLFDRRARAFVRGRPPYPAALYERLRDLGFLRPGLRVLDIGAGAGEATGQFLAAGAHVTAVEPGAALASRIAARWGDVTVLNSTFEDAVLPPAGFDVAVCATALHWLDLDTALPKLREALTPEGWLAAWWTVFGDPAVATPFRRKVAAITSRREAGPRTHPTPLDTDYWLGALTRDGHFASVETQEYRWTVDLTSSQVRDLFSTFTGWSDTEIDEAAAEVDDLGGRVREHYVTALYLCRVAGQPADPDERASRVR